MTACERCGGDTPAGHRFCSSRCIGLTFGVQRKRVNVTGVCAGCGHAFYRERKHRDIGKFCSRQCFFDLKRANAEMRYRDGIRTTKQRKATEKAVTQAAKVCQTCGVASSRAYCGRACELAMGRQKYRESYNYKTQSGVCPQCGKTWLVTGRQGTKVFCSRECMVKAHRSSGSPERRARCKGVSYQKVNAKKVLQRDGWRCRLCGVKTPSRLRGTLEPNAPEVDHIVPLALGGPHTYDNVQCACRKCNQAKGGAWVGQRRLMFDERSVIATV